MRVLFNHAGYWTIESQASHVPSLIHDDLDDWLYSDLVDQLARKLGEIREKSALQQVVGSAPSCPTCARS